MTWMAGGLSSHNHWAGDLCVAFVLCQDFGHIAYHFLQWQYLEEQFDMKGGAGVSWSLGCVTERGSLWLTRKWEKIADDCQFLGWSIKRFEKIKWGWIKEEGSHPKMQRWTLGNYSLDIIKRKSSTTVRRCNWNTYFVSLRPNALDDNRTTQVSQVGSSGRFKTTRTGG